MSARNRGSVIIDDGADGCAKRDPKLEHDQHSTTKMRRRALLKVQLRERHKKSTKQVSLFHIGFSYFAIPKRRREKYSRDGINF